MTKLFPVIFFLIVGLAVGGIDYLSQSRHAGTAPGSFGLSAYVDTVTDRYFGQMAANAAARRRSELIAQPERDHLPEPPDGWQRRDWDEAAAALLTRRYDLEKDDFVPDAIKNDPMMRALGTMDKAAQARADATEVYVYERGDDLVALRLRFRKGDAPGGIAGLAAGLVAGNIEAMSDKQGFAIVEGVTFREELGLFGGVAGQDDRPFRVITGKIGDRIAIMVNARASDPAILELLKAVDYDLLNSMLDEPVPGIGSDAPAIADDAMKAEADLRVDAAAAAQREDAAAQMQRMQAAALDYGHAMGSNSDADYERAKNLTQAAGAATAGETSVPEEAAPAGQGGGLSGWLRATFGKSEEAESEEEPPAPIKVNRPGNDNCVRQGAAKRCSVGGG